MQAMESGVERVALGAYEEVTLDIGVMTEYKGEGKCREITCYSYTADKYREEIRVWARSIRWRITQDCELFFTIKRLREL